MHINDILAQPVGNLADCVRAHAAERPHHLAVVDDQRSVGYAEFDQLADRVAASLQRDGLRPGDALAVCAAASIEYAAVFIGGLRAGVAIVPLAPSSTPASLAGMVDDAEARLLFIGPDVLAEIAALRDGIGARLVGLADAPTGLSFEAWLAPAGSRPEVRPVDAEQVFNIIYSSGTTGTPKGIVHGHALRWNQIRRVHEMGGYGPEAVTLISTPLYSNTTLVSFIPTLALGGTAVLMPKFDAQRYLELAERYRVNHSMLVPVQYQRLMARADFGNYDLSAFRMKFSTSAPMSAALKADVLKRWPGGLVEYYGMTEGGGSCALAAHEFPAKLHTVGRPMEGHDIRLIDDHGHEVPIGEIGEVVGHSGAIMAGYHKQPEKTAAAEWRDASGKRFIRTGDVGRFDEDGFLTLLDRKKDMIISGGFNIYPSDLESILRQHPDVADCAVVGVPSQRWGETPVAFVVRREGAPASAGALMDWTNERVGKTQRLAAVELAEELPRSAIGKVLKRELRDGFRPGRPLD
ncbi:class I adenylate-forming enzyme family protein [Cupriavidus basilensis]|uniref:Class I adenylate-forming enzyme family protein n=1 Tax=Cupriavidus basilensis TaxID=68895 RepID=A0ABT6AKV2_9BURK|nr:class I adenylate-forming enzyme family protein [Cupriavidus basilensis]MDF3833079.1 class I adenylate-forming enzyme family protein [Cupriavidus basilensis]